MPTVHIRRFTHMSIIGLEIVTMQPQRCLCWAGIKWVHGRWAGEMDNKANNVDAGARLASSQLVQPTGVVPREAHAVMLSTEPHMSTSRRQPDYIPRGHHSRCEVLTRTVAPMPCRRAAIGIRVKNATAKRETDIAVSVPVRPDVDWTENH